jgi:hypothetical protein
MINTLADHLDLVIIGAAVAFFFFQTQFTGRSH